MSDNTLTVWVKKRWLTIGTFIILFELVAAIALFGDIR